jgi:C4-dicarboxylate-specific signal transduction histidine kinase
MIYTSKGILIVCDLSGKIKTVHYCKFNNEMHNVKEKLFIDLFRDESIGKALGFFVEIKTNTASFGWELLLKPEYTSNPVHFGGALIDDGIIIYGSDTKVDYSNFASEMTQIQNEQINTIRTLEKEKSDSSLSKINSNSSIYDELSRLNNELVGMQRELAKKNMELENHRSHLEEIVDERTGELKKAFTSLKLANEKDKKYAAILEKTLEKEKELQVFKSNIITTISHEFRTPLTSILSSTELINRYSDKWSKEKRKEHVDRIEMSVDYITKMLNDTLTINQTESGQTSLNSESVDLPLLIKDCICEFQKLTIDSQEIVFDFDSNENNFQLDKKQMYLIVSNLLSNALKFSPISSKVEIRLIVKSMDFIIEVSDHGIGILQEEKDKIFNKFFRGTNAKNIPGLGLGLSILKRAVDLHRGEISVSSELNIGTTFNIRIPLNV